ncbi:DNA polymerase [Paracoccus isoporae]|uniref:Type-4 uracil-DNA glycosylase n=1 Tax=Paracoccus isoporae TaxID=591205 RepID=A0A1G6Z9Q7_9RHOB|nr:UdgX family uracil-DNA binding protein [Paracoccus isoporae]SDD99378.1 DNA polymerase [Paracoccus isoporae]
MIRIALPRFGSFDAWRDAARQLASAGVPAADIAWTGDDAAPELFAAQDLPPPGPQPVRASRAFLSLARQVSTHADAQRWAWLYAGLLRLQDDPGYLANPADPMAARFGKLAKSVRRDIHKMHAFLRFHELPAAGPRRSFAAWFEPDHPILEPAIPFFVKRFADMDWLIATPQGTARFDGRLHLGDPVPRPDLPEDASHDLWQTYFANIFNPARIKTQAMRSEMPRKYWKNLPETALIPEMLNDAPRRVRAMQDAGASTAPAFAPRVTARIRHAPDDRPPATMADARAQAGRCTRCDLCQHATQTVWGAGDPAADLMIVGEAPGDHEDLQGRPFVGPAGQLLRETMDRVGLSPDRAWLTNAVKHFKFAARGKRRLHQNPNAGEISHCRWWLGLERRFVAPRLTVAMGASAAFALTGDRSALTPRRGRIEAAMDRGPVLITWHPSRILRLTGAEAGAAQREFAADLRQARDLLAG